MFRTLLVPVDGSPEGYELVERAVELAAAFDATLHVAFLEELRPGFTMRGLAHASRETDAPADEDREHVATYVNELAAKAAVECDTTVSRGERHVAILNAAGRVDADLIVLADPDRRLWRRLPVTCVDRVVRTASTSVIVVDV